MWIESVEGIEDGEASLRMSRASGSRRAHQQEYLGCRTRGRGVEDVGVESIGMLRKWGSRASGVSRMLGPS